jgi:hypothetical protein
MICPFLPSHVSSEVVGLEMYKPGAMPFLFLEASRYVLVLQVLTVWPLVLCAILIS